MCASFVLLKALSSSGNCLCSDRDAGESWREHEVRAVRSVERVQDQNEVRLLPTPLKIGLWLVRRQLLSCLSKVVFSRRLLLSLGVERAEWRKGSP